MNWIVKTKQEIKEDEPKEETTETIEEELKEEIQEDEPNEEEKEIIDDPNKIFFLEEMTKMLKEQTPKKYIW